jgi:hypothetical protein
MVCHSKIINRTKQIISQGGGIRILKKDKRVRKVQL